MFKFLKCDILRSGANIICHQVNCKGVMGSGVAKQIREQFPNVYDIYKQKCTASRPHKLLGVSQFVPVVTDKTPNFLGVFNLFGQKDYGYDGKQYTDYQALRTAFTTMKSCIDTLSTVSDKRFSVAIPYKIGCGRGGGDWDVVLDIIYEVFNDSRYDILICEYDGG